MLVALGILVAVTVIGVVHLWPHGSLKSTGRQFTQPHTVPAAVTAVAATSCGAPGATSCRRVTVRIEGGSGKGQSAAFVTGLSPTDPKLGVGDRVRMYRNNLPPGAKAYGRPVSAYSFADVDRGRPMLWLTVLFCALVLITSRLRGLRALIGLGISLLIVVEFVVPAILHGGSPIGVALVGSFAVMLTTIPLAHGLGAKAIAATLGTAAALLLTAALAQFFTEATHLSGVGSDESVFLGATTTALSLQGILLAGIVIAALGVLDDLTVSQSSTVMALRRANPALGFKGPRPRRDRRRPRPHRRHGEHARARLRRRLAAGAAHLQHRRHELRPMRSTTRRSRSRSSAPSSARSASSLPFRSRRYSPPRSRHTCRGRRSATSTPTRTRSDSAR